jgi:hypothetical protein
MKPERLAGLATIITFLSLLLGRLMAPHWINE